VRKIGCVVVAVALVAVGALASGSAFAAKGKPAGHLVVAAKAKRAGHVARRHRPRCRVPSRAKVLAKSRRLLVYQDNNFEDVYFFCVRPNGRTETLLASEVEFQTTHSKLVGGVRLAGRYAAFRYRWERAPCSQAYPCAPGEQLQGYYVAINRPGLPYGPVGDSVGENDTTFGLTAGGVLAWLKAVPGGEELHVLGGPFGTQAPGLVVDSGAIDPASFSVQGTTLSWTNAGTPKTFSLSG
jgi:hypothetical protein